MLATFTLFHRCLRAENLTDKHSALSLTVIDFPKINAFMKFVVICLAMLSGFSTLAQQNYYDVTAGTGYGIRFWQNDGYKIHMGTGPAYQYGPVTDYSIKFNMSVDAGRGWTWGVDGYTPIAALSNAGNMQIAGSLTTGGDIILPNEYGNRQIFTWQNGDNNWRIGMSTSPGFTRSLVTSHTQYLTYSNAPGQGFAVGVNGGQSSFEVSGSNHNAFFRGDLGVGTATPDGLQINAELTNETSLGTSNIRLGLLGGTPRIILDYTGHNTFQFDNFEGRLRIYTPGVERFTILSNGNVGIGTSNPGTFKLAVEGKIGAREVNVNNTAPWPDYVFESDYDLPSLAALEAFIKANKHLPQVPTASEVEKSGIALGEMNLILLKKIEELTLYVIKQQAEIDSLKKSVAGKQVDALDK